MNIRPATKADLKQIIEIYSKDQIIGKYENLSPEKYESYNNTFESIESDPNQLLIVAEEKDIVKGTLQVSCVQYLMGDSYRAALVEAMFVHPQFLNQGIGKLLMSKAEDWAKEKHCGSIKLSSNMDRKKAHLFYEKLGYVSDHISYRKRFNK